MKFWAVLLLFFLVSPARAEEIIFIVNNENKLSEISQDEVVDFFFKRKRHWPDGERVRFIDQKDGSAEKQAFLKTILGKTARDLDLFWIGEKNFNGQGAPIQAPSEDMVISTVASLPGAIGYISASHQQELVRVKRILIKGQE